LWDETTFICSDRCDIIRNRVGVSGGTCMNGREDVLKILESIANSFDKESVQYKAIEEAAQSFMFLNMHKELRKAYEVFRSQTDKDLSEEQKQHLRDMGIEVD
jgi:hypothetical protein